MSEQINSYPTLSEKNWWAIREKFKASIPSSVSTTYVKSLLSMANDNSANSNVISPLKRIGLIDDENKPTALANDWRIDEKYKTVCDTIIKNVYPAELLDLFPESDVDRGMARSWFMSLGVGQGAADKMVAFFMLLKSGKIKDKKTITAANNPTAKSKSITAKNEPRSKDAKTPKVETVASKGLQNNNCPNLHIDLQIHISPDSTPEQIEAIFASMAKHLYGADNK